MESHRIAISLKQDGALRYDTETGWVTITGQRVIKNLVNPDSKPESTPYMYQVKIDVEGFRPWVTGWQEGEIK